ncbi:hypothetical protein LPB67_06835 [Undibacterium sp. Jales W-56]|uniref:pilus assembly protein n=1 Tax=Undibacterium sp. Jales W-56 TaxID=2897325 RepID=UPI0021CF5DE6|nr:PilC/PilY family type IV pilus protein [Undibacterium sp. Jales W-56]MCU6433496.1 hypothetical protein [Undibacterium sp. Jales W-56]
MNFLFLSKRWGPFLSLSLSLAVAPVSAIAEDIDIYLGSSGGTATAPKVMIMLDNTTNDLFPAKLSAIKTVLDKITVPMDIGLALYSPTGSPKGAYIRFAPRNVGTDMTNRTALKNILSLISTKNEYNGLKDEPEAFYEIFKYFTGTNPYAGGLPPKNPNVDIIGNAGSYAGATAFGQGMTSGFAYSGTGPYSSVSTTCANDFIIYIAANNGFSPGDVQGNQSYEGLSAGPALPPASLATYWGDEWTHYLYNYPGHKISTYVLDAASPGNSDAFYTSYLQAEAKQGGGTWQYVTSEAEIVTALMKILVQIQGINSTFASASLPVNATNRDQNKNQVFIPMFRPTVDASPRWMGNLKQYQVIGSGNLDLGDVTGAPAISPVTGFVTECATSFWTSDSGTYWNNLPGTPKGTCPVTSYSPYSDSPDGPIVEKGGVAEVIRKGNNPPATDTSPTWLPDKRVIYTQPAAGGSLATFSATSPGLATETGLTGTPLTDLANFVLGQDVNDENGNKNYTESRPSLHGDAIHSRPLPIDYGTNGVTAYYGANDGMLRAVDTKSGQERWAFVAPEFYSKLPRLKNNLPLISYPTMPPLVTPTPTPKDYYFDGSISLYQSLANAKIWIYPTMRRGGRMLYAFDVTNPATPAFKWKLGCPHLGDDNACIKDPKGFDMSNIGQTWSTPRVTSKIQGYTGPVLVMGAGYDKCEDDDKAAPSCSITPKGAFVYVIDADTGVVIKSFPTLRSVAADVALLPTAGVVDHAYAADTGGNIYRIDFGASVSSWSMTRVAYTNGAGRKFLFAPALLRASATKVYLALGSGDREHPLQSNYPFNPSPGITNRFYVYVDDLAVVPTTANNLDDTKIMYDRTVSTASSCNDLAVLPSSTMKGWFMDLNQHLPGFAEQTVTSALIVGGTVMFSTNRPVPTAAGTCSTPLGKAEGYMVNLFNGSGAIGVLGACGGARSSTFVGGGLPPSPVLATVPINGKPTTIIIGAANRSGAACGSLCVQTPPFPSSPKRKTIYWKSSGQN